jgi:hypothetical protein
MNNAVIVLPSVAGGLGGEHIKQIRDRPAGKVEGDLSLGSIPNSLEADHHVGLAADVGESFVGRDSLDVKGLHAVGDAVRWHPRLAWPRGTLLSARTVQGVAVQPAGLLSEARQAKAEEQAKEQQMRRKAG